MKSIRWIVLLLALLLTSAAAQAQTAPPDSSQVQLVQIATGFDRPLYLTVAGDGAGRLFVVEQSGHIWIIKDGQKLPTPFLDVSGLISHDVFGGGYTERGLLGLVFAPDYPTSGIFYIDYTDLKGTTNVVRYHVSADNPDLADPASAETILTQQQPFANHNGGQLAFGPDGYLYIGLGDGGSAGDPHGNGQNINTWLGKLLRIDVSGSAYTVPADNPFVNTANARRKSGRMVCAIPGASASTGRRAICISGMSARPPGKKSIFKRWAIPAARTTAGTPTRGCIPTAARPRPPTWCCRWPNIRTAMASR